MKYKNILTKENLNLYDHFIYDNLINSLYLRKQGNIIPLDENNSSILIWGLSIIVGGDFSIDGANQLISLLKNFDSPRYLYLPNNNWRSFIKSKFSTKATDKKINSYIFDNTKNIPLNQDEHVVAITRNFMEKNLLNTECILEELYSYTSLEDFYQNGFGVALVIDEKVVGFCLSEYSVNNSVGANIWIDEQYRGLGYAKKMVNTFLMHFQEKKQLVYWVCDDDNIKSNNLAKSTGFILKSTDQYFEI